MALKENAIARTSPPGTQATRYKAPDNLLTFLHQL
jgi:integrase/recombinase XerD